MTPEEKEAAALVTAMAHIPKEELLSLPYFQNRGAHFVERAFIKDERGRWERVFSDTIKELVERHGYDDQRGPLGTSPEQIKGSLTCFQWLATSCGQSVLFQALRECGITVKYEKKV